MKGETSMALVAMFLSTYCCVLLQFVSRNLFYVIVALSGVLSIMLLQVCYKKNCWYWSIPSIAANGFLLYGSLQMHLLYGHQINDYLITSILLGIFILLTIVEVLPRKKKVSRE